MTVQKSLSAIGESVDGLYGVLLKNGSMELDFYKPVGGVISGHSLKHLLASLAPATLLVYLVQKRAPPSLPISLTACGFSR